MKTLIHYNYGDNHPVNILSINYIVKWDTNSINFNFNKGYIRWYFENEEKRDFIYDKILQNYSIDLNKEFLD